MSVAVTTWSLEMRQPSDLVGVRRPAGDCEVRRALAPTAEFGRFLYTATGGSWHWTDRLGWTYEQWTARLRDPAVETWVLWVEGTPAGYFELDAGVPGEVELAYFGLTPGFIGRGLGGWLLTRALERAWELGPARVWVHTCSLDGPHARANYEARGMRVFREEIAEQDLDDPPGPWPGAQARGEP